jgi:hypothetical protein
VFVLAGAPAGADEPQRPWSRLWGSAGKHDRSGGVVIAVTDPDGSALWTRVWGSIENDYAHGVAVDASNAVCVAGETDGVIDGQPNGGYT